MCPPDPDSRPEASPTDEADGAERRRSPRVPLQLLVQYRFDSLDDFLAEYSVDMSVGGMFIRTHKPREEGAFVYLQFALRDGPRLIEGLGRVVRVNPPDVEGSVPGMGIEFVNMDAESNELIEEIVANKVSAR